MYIARFRNDDLIQQPLKEHISNVSIIASYFARKVHLEITLKLIGLLHDMGKYAEEFQKFIFRQFNRASKDMQDYLSSREQSHFDHGAYGAKYILEYMHKKDMEQRRAAEIIALVVAYHHRGLPDCENENGKISLLERTGNLKEEELKEVTDRYFAEIQEDIGELFEEACQEISALFSLFEGMSDKDFMDNLTVKMLYSMLIDADRLDAMCFDIHEEYQQYLEEETCNDWMKYVEIFEKYLAELNNTNSKENSEETFRDKVNVIRQQISDECEEAAQLDTGIYWLTVPTGGGKTLSSLRFALHHNDIRGKERIIYVLPYTSIIEQNAEAVRKALHYQCNLLEHHSNVIRDNDQEEYRLLTERWDSEIIFTTMVQFLNTFYAKKTQNMRRLHHLLNATIIFDEVQTVPVKCLYLFNSAVNFLYTVGQSTIVLSSATQPNLDTVERPILLKNGRKELIQSVDEKFKQLKRTEIVNCTAGPPKTLDETVEFILEKKEAVKSLLVVVNKIKSAAALYLELKEKTDAEVILLTSCFCPKHREDILQKLYHHLERKDNLICVSTCLIEAGIDISFEAAIRNITKLDSIIQTAGRVNRHGENPMGYCYVINMDEGSYGKMREVEIGGIHTDEALDECEDTDAISKEIIEKYFEAYFGDKQIRDEFQSPVLFKGKKAEIYKMLSNSGSNVLESNKNKLFLWIRFAEAAERFSVIEQDTETLIVPYKEGMSLMNELERVTEYTSFEEKRKLLEASKKYSVNVYSYQRKALEGAVTYQKELGLYLLGSGNYDEKMGLSLKSSIDDYII